MLNAVDYLSRSLPAAPRESLTRLLQSPVARRARAEFEDRMVAAGTLLGRWLDVLGPEFDLSDLELHDHDIQADLRRGRR